MLFAKSGNRCAFPKCPTPIVEKDALVGEVAHIEAENKGGPRYNEAQSEEDRRNYDNLILLCANHHKVVDDDEEAYTVERLIKMKKDHESRAGEPLEALTGRAVSLLDQSVTTVGQQGGVTAHTIHFNLPNNFQSKLAEEGFPAQIEIGEPGLFRGKNEALGLSWGLFPMNQEHEVYLDGKTYLWLRLVPMEVQKRVWRTAELSEYATLSAPVKLLPMNRVTVEHLRAKDGFGVYSRSNSALSDTQSIAFVFESGELWSIDTTIFQYDEERIFVGEVLRGLGHIAGYVSFLREIGVTGPLQWIAGIVGIQGRHIEYPPPMGYANLSRGATSLKDVVRASAIYDESMTAFNNIKPLVEELYAAGSMKIPSHLDLILTRM